MLIETFYVHSTLKDAIDSYVVIHRTIYWIRSIKVCSESLDTKSKTCDYSEDLSAIKKIFLEIEDIVKKHIFYLSISEKVQKFALKSQK